MKTKHITIWKQKLQNKNIGKRNILFFVLVIIVFIFVVIPFIKLPLGNKYCCEQPLVRWKFAVYYGECWEGEGGDGCKFTKIEGTGWREYFGLKDFECPCDKK